MNQREEREDVCESARKAALEGGPLSPEQEAHLAACADCRAFLNDVRILRRDLALLEPRSLERNGVSVADAVMREVALQKTFDTRKKPWWMKHIGLAAAPASASAPHKAEKTVLMRYSFQKTLDAWIIPHFILR